jgi:putative tricarboxylic transport membrane protein
MALDILQHIAYGFSVALAPTNLLYCFFGVFIGTLIGVLPGIGPAGAMALLLPVTFSASPVTAIITLSGIYYGAQYGGSTTSILLNIPGEASSVITCLDGNKMARNGRAGPALGMAAFASFIAGTVGIVLLSFLAPFLASFALRFGPPEYFSIMCLGLSIVIYLAAGSISKALIMVLFGIILSQVGLDNLTAIARLSYSIPELFDGIGLVPVAMGIFGLGEVFYNLEKEMSVDIYKTSIRGLLPSLQDWADSYIAILQGTIIGFFLGILPGGGAVVASFACYGLQKKISRHPERLGTGVIEGVAAPEAANNAAAQGAFIPLFTLAVPSNVVMAILLGALMMHGVSPGPFLLSEHPEIFWGVVSSMYIGNVMLLLLNLPLITLWVRVIAIPYYKVLMPLIILFCLIGVYATNLAVVDLGIMVFSGGFGYLMKKFEYEAAPLLLGFVLGPLIEINLRHSLQIADGSLLVFFTRPISALGMAVTVLLLSHHVVTALMGRKRRVFMDP